MRHDLIFLHLSKESEEEEPPWDVGLPGIKVLMQRAFGQKSSDIPVIWECEVSAESRCLGNNEGSEKYAERDNGSVPTSLRSGSFREGPGKGTIHSALSYVPDPLKQIGRLQFVPKELRREYTQYLGYQTPTPLFSSPIF